jgi:peptidoglycan hydrolase-like protein with peptidoglycan-binding domain
MPKLRGDQRSHPAEPAERIGRAEPANGSGRAPRRRRGRSALILVILLIGAGVGWLIAPRSPDTTGATGSAPTTFGKVVRTDVQARTDLPGGLAYVADRTVANRFPGPEGGATLTGVAAQGIVVRRGDRLFSVDERPVVLLLGRVPSWRTLRVGAVGADVGQLDRNLEALGYGGFTVRNTFTPATRAAVRRWQRDIGARADGVVDLGEVVFLPRAVRIDQHLLTPGDAVSSGAEVLTVGPTAPVVTVDLEPTQLSLVSVGDRVIVRLADGTETSGTVVSVGREGAGEEQPGTAGTVPAIVSLKSPADAAGLAGSSATVSVVTDTHDGVLAVPVTALLAVPGGYVVQVDRGDRIQTVDVRPGLFDGIAGLVEVKATGLEAGDRVVVAEAGA